MTANVKFTRRICPSCHKEIGRLGWSKKHGVCVDCAPPAKYRNKRTEVNGISFHSKKESERYVELKWRMQAGEIHSLRLQPRYPIVVNAVRICDYVADFQYIEAKSGEMVIEDVKSVATTTQLYKVKRKLVEALYGIKIVEVM